MGTKYLDVYYGVYRGILASVLLVSLAACANLQAQDGPLSVENPSDASGFITVKFKLSKGDDVQWDVSPKPTRKLSYVEGEYSVLVLNGPEGTTYTVTADWINWDAKKRGRPSVDAVVGKLPKPPPVPPGPGPGPSPTPQPDTEPVTSFHAFVIYKLGQRLSPTELGIIDGLELETALNAARGPQETANFAWRKISRDSDPSTLPAGLREAWTVAQKSIVDNNSKLPAISFKVNGKTTIEPLPTTVAEAVALVAKYRRK